MKKSSVDGMSVLVFLLAKMHQFDPNDPFKLSLWRNGK
jgi:hypothetical protein